MMHDDGKSDRPVVPRKAENVNQTSLVPTGMNFWAFMDWLEGRGLAKENADPAQQDDWTQSHLREEPRSAPEALPNALDRIRQAARRDKKLRFTNLWHHVYDIGRLRQAYLQLRRWAAPGVDGQTWHAYGENLEANLRDLSERLRRGTYKARPVKRAYVPKADGKQRPIGIPVLEDKIVQRATVEVLNAVYEADFKGFSYGFRPSRGAHQALDALAVAIQTRKVNWVLDADIRSFFDTLDHQWLLKFVEHRIADPQVLRHIRKWLKAGVMEQGRRYVQEEGTPQGGSISPLLANVYLHYVLDLWAEQWRKRQTDGELIIVRYADDFVVGFEREADARRFLEDLRERFGRFHLELHAEKTRIIQFGAAGDARYRKGVGDKPATFHFLGFTHSCSRTRWGRFIVLRRTMAKRMRAKLRALKEALRRHMHESISTTGAWLRSLLSGYFRYFGVPRNSQPLWAFRAFVIRLWRGALNRRSQRRTTTWARMGRIARRWLPYPRICQPYPEDRLRVRIQGKSPVR